uniref:Uncharacterized protein n=1 Tax=Fibrocapsa japonica TaxID=94617 RepID=A0A7S2XVS5_9STRA|mmetsp:Transcript_16663/g.24489  ORF Transcript_16663/g.24489 Transcript_16663/m.24489 type:complete len:306 (+) Transcript_16663:83-1000(+)
MVQIQIHMLWICLWLGIQMSVMVQECSGKDNTVGNCFISSYRSVAKAKDRPFSLSSRRRTTSMATTHFINLTNGIEAMPDLVALGIATEDLDFLRIQSSHCEQCNFAGIIQELDHNFLMKLAQGHTCLVYDLGCRGTQWPDGSKGIPRALWWGLEWVRYCLGRSWRTQDGCRDKVYIRGYNVEPLWSKEYNSLPKTLRKKLRYYRPYCNLDPRNSGAKESGESGARQPEPCWGPLRLHGIYRCTEIDGQRDKYVDILKTCLHSSNNNGGLNNHFLNGEAIKLPDGMSLFDSSKYDGTRCNCLFKT